ncbi:hypothetical protein F5Y03DRAFT_391619 [Xylaria venustula]|nr:hypothetical protein F5Y03DRAFT_391619 [Xylaria venustula]
MSRAADWLAGFNNSGGPSSSHTILVFTLNVILIITTKFVFALTALFNYAELRRLHSNPSFELIWLLTPDSTRTRLYLLALFPAPIWATIYSMSWIFDGNDLLRIRGIPFGPFLKGSNFLVNVASFILYTELQSLYDNNAEELLTRRIQRMTTIATHLPFPIALIAVIISRETLPRSPFVLNILTAMRGILLVIKEVVITEHIFKKLKYKRSMTFKDVNVRWTSRMTKIWEMGFLFGLNFAAILLNGCLTNFEWTGDHNIDTGIKCFIYSIKWNVELHIFRVLRQLHQNAATYRDNLNRARCARVQEKAPDQVGWIEFLFSPRQRINIPMNALQPGYLPFCGRRYR